jgi:hypothetical protein
MPQEKVKVFEGQRYVWSESSSKYLPEVREHEGQTYKWDGSKYAPSSKKTGYEQVPSSPYAVSAPIHHGSPSKVSRDVVSPVLEGTAVSAGRLGGSALGGPVGGLAGGVAADMAYKNTFQRFLPNWFGKAEEDLGSQVLDSGKNTLLDAAGSKLIEWAPELYKGLTRGDLKARIINKLFPTAKDASGAPIFKEEMEAAMGAKDDLTVGQVTQNPSAMALEDKYLPQQKAGRLASQQQRFSNELNQLGTEESKVPFDFKDATTPEFRAKSDAEAAATGHKSLSTQIRGSFEGFEKTYVPKHKDVIAIEVPGSRKTSSVLGPDGKPVVTETKPRFERHDVEGPVYPEQTMKAAKEQKANIDALLDDITFTSEVGRKKAQEISRMLEEITSLPQSAATKRPVMSWEAAQKHKRALADIMNSADEDLKARLKGTAERLTNLLGMDEAASVGTWSKEAKADFDKMFALNKKKHMRYDPKLSNDLYKSHTDQEIIKSKLMDDALSNPEKAQHWINATGERHELGGEFLHRLLNGNYDFAQKGFDAERMINSYFDTENKAVANKVLSSKTRQGLEFALKRLRLAGGNVNKSASIGIQNFENRGAVEIASSLGKLVATGKAGGGLSWGTSVVMSVPLSRKVVEKLFFNPEVARKVGRLAMLPPESHEARAISKSIHAALKGSQYLLQYGDGSTEEKTIE